MTIRLLLCLLLSAFAAFSQIRSGTITGAVVDPSNAAVPDAQVTITNTGTNISNSTRTTQAGLYTLPYLETGTYSISITKAGFEAFQANGVHVESSQSTRLDATLRLGSTGTKLEVIASAVQLQTDSSTVSGATSAQVIDAIPNVTQNPIYYAALQNGVQPRNNTSNSTSVGSFALPAGVGATLLATGLSPLVTSCCAQRYGWFS